MPDLFNKQNQSGKFGVSGSANCDMMTRKAVLLKFTQKVPKSTPLKNANLFRFEDIAFQTIKKSA